VRPFRRRAGNSWKIPENRLRPAPLVSPKRPSVVKYLKKNHARHGGSATWRAEPLRKFFLRLQIRQLFSERSLRPCRTPLGVVDSRLARSVRLCRLECLAVRMHGGLKATTPTVASRLQQPWQALCLVAPKQEGRLAGSEIGNFPLLTLIAGQSFPAANHSSHGRELFATDR